MQAWLIVGMNVLTGVGAGASASGAFGLDVSEAGADDVDDKGTSR